MIKEGIGDKFLKQQFNINDPKEQDFEHHFFKEENPNWVGEITHSYRNTKFKTTTNIYKNPKTLEAFDPMVRGIIMANGDLYISDNAREIIHIDLVKFLIHKKIITGASNTEELFDLMSEERLHPKQFINIVRAFKTNIICPGESAVGTLENMKFIHMAQKQNPTLKFANRDPYLLKKDLDLTEQFVLVREFLTDERQMELGYQKMKQDYNNYGLNKSILGTMTDENGEIVKICAVNGMYVRDKHPGLDFDQFVDGGHYYVDSYHGYKKHIPKDEIWVDDVFILKPFDLKAIVLHEFVERNKMKYHKWSYSRAHEHANKIETKFREKHQQ